MTIHVSRMKDLDLPSIVRPPLKFLHAGRIGYQARRIGCIDRLREALMLGNGDAGAAGFSSAECWLNIAWVSEFVCEIDSFSALDASRVMRRACPIRFCNCISEKSLVIR